MHLQVLEQVLSASHGVLMWKVQKCCLLTLETSFLGHLCSSTGIWLDPVHIQAVVDFLRPQTLKAVRSFCRMANRTARHLPNFAAMIAPLFDLTKRGVMIARVWDEDDRYERAFVQVKKLMKRAWTLAMPDWKQLFNLVTDASGVAIGAVLYQVIDGQSRPLAFWSRKLPCQRDKWSVMQKEAYAVLVFT